MSREFLKKCRFFLKNFAAHLDAKKPRHSAGQLAKKSLRRSRRLVFYRLQVLDYTSSMIAISAASPRRAPVRVTRV